MSVENKRPTSDIHRYRLYKLIHFLKEKDAKVTIGNTIYEGKGGDGLKTLIETALLWDEEGIDLPDTLLDELLSRKYYYESLSLDKIKEAAYSYIIKVELDHVPILLDDVQALDKYLVGELSKNMYAWYKFFTKVPTEEILKKNSIDNPIYERFDEIFPDSLSEVQKNLLLFLQINSLEVQTIIKACELKKISQDKLKKAFSDIIDIVDQFKIYADDILDFMRGYTLIYKNYSNEELNYIEGSYVALLKSINNGNSPDSLISERFNLEEYSLSDVLASRHTFLKAQNSSISYHFLDIPKVKLATFYAEWELKILQSIFAEILNREYRNTTFSIYFSRDGSPKASKIESNLSIADTSKILSNYLLGKEVNSLGENDSGDKYSLINKTLGRSRNDVAKQIDSDEVEVSIRKNLVQKYQNIWGM